VLYAQLNAWLRLHHLVFFIFDVDVNLSHNCAHCKLVFAIFSKDFSQSRETFFGQKKSRPINDQSAKNREAGRGEV
jgi:hypothetical protein